MTAPKGPRSAPGLFEALEMEGGPALRARSTVAVPGDIDEEVTAPRALEEMTDDDLGYSGLADALEPGKARPAPGSVAAVLGGPDFDDDMVTAPRKPVPQPIAPDPSSASLALDMEDVPRPRSLVPVAFAAVVVLLGGALAFVLYTQTDLFSGDVIAIRDAKVRAEAERELAEINAEQARNNNEYGTVQLNSQPDGARVWLVKAGPEAVFENLPRGNEYQVFVDAPGHAPRIETVAGADLGNPVQVDLSPLPPSPAAEGTGGAKAERPHPPLPETDPPSASPGADARDVGVLTVRTATPDAQIGLHVGYTPGATLTDLDVREGYELRITKAGFEDHILNLRGRHFEEAGGELVYMDNITLTAAPPHPEAPEDAGDDVVIVDEEPPTPAKKTKKRRKNKRRKNKRR